METKQEFIDGLRRALTGRISQQEVEEHIRYYDEYITAEIRMGRAESDVLRELGDPRLIAMSICAAGEAAGGNKEGNESNRYQQGYEGYQGTQEQRRDAGMEEKSGNDSRSFIFRHPKLTIALIIAVILVVIVLIIALAFSLLQILWPVILVVVIIGLVARLIAYLREH